MTDLLSDDVPPGLPGGETLGVMDAVRMGWRLMMADFWPIWLLGLVVYAIQAGCGVVGATPYIGGCIALAVGLFVQAPLNAGLFFAVRRRIDGAPAQVGDLFEGFRQRYWPSVVAILLPTGLALAFGLLIAGGVFAAIGVGGAFGNHHVSEEEMLAAVGVAMLILVPLCIVFGLIMLLFVFSQLAVWDHPESGWQAMKDSVRVVKAHYMSSLGMILLFALIGLAAALAGILACCVGVFFTAPLVMVWFNATLIYLYRSWTGQPLVQPIAVEPPAEGAGPVAPTDIEPPPAPPTDVLPPGV